ncbi:MAG TPA: gliding motility-associated ABC transporter permease subunit GldF [Bacteroidales bacterium]|nr:gliding motility-associated ABC transporter permease subunit GldF [Bacteroidales bacterium]
MWSLYKKEIRGFFSSLTGYVVIVVFLLLNSLFMWVFSGQMNILESGYASLDTLFTLAPWVFLFLVPAITMRMFSEEKRAGTLELLFTRPMSELQIVSAKFLAAWSLVIIAIVPTLIFFGSVWFLGSPRGNIDTGGTWGSYIGLVFLGGIYASVGIFSSSVTGNQIVAFIMAVLLSFLFYLGFNFIGTLGQTGEVVHVIETMGIDYHYQSMARGVIDSRDMIYFISVIFLFLYLTRTVLVSRKW